MIGIIWFIIGTFQYKGVVANSSTPIGTSMKFNRSQVDVTLKDIYTDKKQDVLIARLSAGSSANLIPYKGSDYRVYIASKEFGNYQKASILFGRMSTDGDLFLVIPKPNQSVYSIFIMNTKYLSTKVDSSGQTSTSVQDISQSDANMQLSISKALSDYDYNPGDDKSTTYEIGDNLQDVIAFRLTMNPSFKTKAYIPKVIDADLLNKQNEFQFAKFFDKVFKESAVKELQKQDSQLLQQMKQLRTVQSELEERLKANQNDSEASLALSQLKLQLENLQNQELELVKKISAYEALHYDDAYFENLLTKARIVKG